MVVIVEDDVGRVTDARIKAVSGEDDLGLWETHETGQAPKPCSCRCRNWPLSPNTGFSFFDLIEV